MAENIKIAPSVLTAKPWDLKEYCRVFEAAGVDMIHYDVMDGQYVPNITLGTAHFDALHGACSLPLDLHLMTLTPEKTWKFFNVQPGDRVSFHPELCEKPHELLAEIKAIGAACGIVLSPQISENWVADLAGEFDFVLVMAVKPGFGKQAMLPTHLEKLVRVKAFVDAHCPGTEIQVDGSITPQTIGANIHAGANSFVAGSALVGKPGGPADFPEALKSLQSAIKDA